MDKIRCAINVKRKSSESSRDRGQKEKHGKGGREAKYKKTLDFCNLHYKVPLSRNNNNSISQAAVAKLQENADACPYKSKELNVNLSV